LKTDPFGCFCFQHQKSAIQPETGIEIHGRQIAPGAQLCQKGFVRQSEFIQILLQYRYTVGDIGQIQQGIYRLMNDNLYVTPEIFKEWAEIVQRFTKKGLLAR